MEQKTAQLRVKFGAGRRANIITAYGCSGQIFWETPSRARFLIDTGSFELVNAEGRVPVGPSETKPAGPSEVKESLEKKEFSAGAQDGHSTDSAASSEAGPAGVSSASVGGLVSPDRRSPSLKPRGKRGK